MADRRRRLGFLLYGLAIVAAAGLAGLAVLACLVLAAGP